MPDNEKKIPAHVAAKEKFKAGLGPCLANAFVFFLFCCIAAAGSLISPLLSLLLFALLGLPFLFAFTQLIVFYTEKGMMADNRVTWHYFGMYFSRQYLGVYRVLLNALKGIAVGLGTTWLFMLVYGFGMYYGNVDFRAALDEVIRAYNAVDAEAFAKAIEAEPIVRGLATCQLVGTGAGAAMFLFSVSRYGMNPFLRYYSSALPSRVATAFYNKYFSVSRRKYVRLMWKRGYGMQFAFPVGYALGGALAYLTPRPDYLAMPMAIAVGGLFAAAYLPYWLLLCSEFWDRHTRNVLVAQVAVGEDILRHAEAIPGVGEEQLGPMRSDLERQKQQLADTPLEEDDED